MYANNGYLKARDRSSDVQITSRKNNCVASWTRACVQEMCYRHWGETAGLMFSIAGDCSYVNLDTKLFAREFARIIGCELSSKKGCVVFAV
jgi:hypothetical protein